MNTKRHTRMLAALLSLLILASVLPSAVAASEFTDVPEKAFYSAAVNWALSHEPQITKGTSATQFSPNAACTRGQVVTFLWRAMGCPEPTQTANPFTDVRSDQYYYKAVLWAVEKGITKGVSTTAFGPNQSCTRGQVVTFLWRMHGSPTPKSSRNPFVDVRSADYFRLAVLWAVEQGVTNGISKTAFSPSDHCTRGQVVTFLHRTSSPDVALMPAQPDETGVYAAYLTELRNHRSGIVSNPFGQYTALCDVYGDDLPELFYIEKNSAPWGACDLHIVTFENGALKHLLTISGVMAQVQCNDDFVIFGCAGKAAMALCYTHRLETEVTYSITDYRDWTNPKTPAKKTELYEMWEMSSVNYVVNGKPSDAAGYEAAFNAALSGFDRTVLSSGHLYGLPSAVGKLAEQSESLRYSYDELIAFLQGLTS